jgi:hypothetical protein
MRPTLTAQASVGSVATRLRGSARNVTLVKHISKTGNNHRESQRDSGSKPRVARNELPWEKSVLTFPTPTGLCHYSPRSKATTPLGLPIPLSPLPRVARSSQPWAEGPNPFGISTARTLQRRGTLLLGILMAAFALAGCKSNSPSQYISPRVEGRVVDGHSHAPIQGVHVQRVSGDAAQKVPEGQKGGQLMEGTPVVVRTGKDGSFILDSEHDLAFLRKLRWYSVSISFEHPAYESLIATYTLSNAVNTATGEPVVKAGDILLAPLSR